MSTRARVLVNGGVVTLDPSRPRASVLRVEAGRVTHIADDARGLAGERVDLAGAVVLPGLSDAHLHVAGIGRRTRELDLGRLPTLAAALAAIQQQHRARGADAWLLGRGWDQNLWPGGHYPTEEHLEQAAPGRAVALTRIDGHALWVSRRARELAGIGANTVDPPGGSIVRNERGAPTGILLDSAMGLVTARIPEAARGAARRSGPRPARVRGGRAHECARHGGDPRDGRSLRRARARGGAADPRIRAPVCKSGRALGAHELTGTAGTLPGGGREAVRGRRPRLPRRTAPVPLL
ncbi:MAG: amidohydrolase family protein [Myxococcales bacterium]|nr:amidohydrolase family protein [Myxococcales bacterium]